MPGHKRALGDDFSLALSILCPPVKAHPLIAGFAHGGASAQIFFLLSTTPQLIILAGFYITGLLHPPWLFSSPVSDRKHSSGPFLCLLSF